MLKVLELFAGIGACSKALTNLGIEHEIVDAVEIDKYAIKSFNAIHGTDFEPQDITEWDKDYWCPNCGRCFDTGKFHEDDDEMYEDVCPYCGCYPTEPIKGNIDLIMHGSPCQDFSAAGLGAGGDEGSGTRSSLMYETIRIVEKVKPRIVIWENVKNVLSKKHKHNFDAYLERMESLGYKNHYQVLNAKDYGIPQNRERIFTISILAEYDFDFQFPEKQPLTLRLKDILEPQVDESFYLSDVQVGKIKMSTYNQNRTRIQEGDVAQTLCARDWKDPKCVKVGDLDMKGHESMKRVYSADGISPTLTTMGGGNTEPKIIDPQGRLNKFNTPKDYAPTQTTQCGSTTSSSAVLLKEDLKDIKLPGAYGRKFGSRGKIQDMEGHSCTLLADMGTGGGNVPLVTPNYRVRKLTPKECWRLMGFDDADFEKAEKVNSNTQLYKQAGNSIVVNVLEAILKELL